ncbi:Sorting nexin-4-like [Oopsacas minuta]|uniref:Sorting nexin-4-like n=1 Tax=Oopsacas minuta TaxID=111878 RepID=A0AAV7JT84_9METZ|nr:Sorting nexin-4-like [Oopsacas minuta]
MSDLSGEDLFGEPDVKEKAPAIPDPSPTSPPSEPDPNPITDQQEPAVTDPLAQSDDKATPETESIEPDITQTNDEPVLEEDFVPSKPSPSPPKEPVSPGEYTEVKSKIPEVTEPKSNSQEPKGILTLLDIKIAEFEKRKDFVAFKVTSRARLNPGMTLPGETQIEHQGNDILITIMRRYSDFELLRNFLNVKYPSYVIPPLPDKASTNYIMNKVFSSDNSEFLSQRLSFLEIFLTRIHRLTKLSKDIWFERFLFVEKWKDDVQPEFLTATNLAKAYSSSIFSRGPNSPNPEMAEISTFATKTQEFLSALLKSYDKLKSTRQSMFHSTSDFGITLQNWSDVDSSQSEMFQYSSGVIETFQDALAKVEEDEEYKLVGPSREYIAYSEAVKSAVKRQYSMTAASEKAADNHKSKTLAKDKADRQLEEAKTANKNVPKAEERQKIAVTQMEEAKQDMDIREKAVKEFTDEFLLNYKNYQAQRKVDFKAIFLNFSRSQFLLNNSLRESWEKAHKNFKTEVGMSSHRTSSP